MLALIKVIIAAVAALLAIAALLASCRMASLHVMSALASMKYLLAALGAGFLLGWWRGLSGFFRTLEHEATHILFALLMFKKPKQLLVTDDQGGHAAFQGSNSALVSFAPYFFPLTACVLIGVRALAVHSMVGPISLLVVFFLGLHLSFVVGEIKVGQTDLKDYGYWFSFPVTAMLLVPVWSVVFSCAAWGAYGVSRYLNLWVEGMRTVLGWMGGRAF